MRAIRVGLLAIFLVGLAMFLAGVTSSACMAGTATAQFNVTATVLNNCAVSANDLTFGNYSASSGSALTASTSLSVTCTTSLPYTVALDGGTTTSSAAARAMTDGSAHNLTYALYTTSGYVTLWGDGTGGTS